MSKKEREILIKRMKYIASVAVAKLRMDGKYAEANDTVSDIESLGNTFI